MKQNRVAITGGIGSGKSEVASYLVKLGFYVADCDRIARELSEKKDMLEAIEKEFGEGFVSNGMLNRKKLGSYVFGSQELTLRLNMLFYKRMCDELFMRLDTRPDRLIFADVPLLFEYGLQDRFDEVWVVEAPLDKRIERVMARDGLDKKAVVDRMLRQTNQRRAGNCKLIENDGEKQDLHRQIDCLLLPFTEKYVKI